MEARVAFQREQHVGLVEIFGPDEGIRRRVIPHRQEAVHVRAVARATNVFSKHQ